MWESQKITNFHPREVADRLTGLPFEEMPTEYRFVLFFVLFLFHDQLLTVATLIGQSPLSVVSRVEEEHRH